MKCFIALVKILNPSTFPLRIIIERDGKLDLKEYQYSMRMYYPHEMDILLSENGFIIREKLGDYDGTPMTDESHMQIYVCKSN